ncbi:MAG TPA: UxaA family hydrolase, partial [Propylenella sp.]|nr:UxaA family hydrolase [Propylenella sp.]
MSHTPVLSDVASLNKAAVAAPARRYVRLHANDNVVVATASLPTGTVLDAEGVTVARAVPMGHKIATGPIRSGEAVIKFGQIIGYATADIAPGAHVHVHNCAMGEHDQNYQIGVDYRPVQYREPMGATFKGLRRADGRVGTRNFIALCSTVNCSATVIRHIADRINRSGVLESYPHIDGVIALSHGSGCGMADTGEGFEALERVLWGHATHPN